MKITKSGGLFYLLLCAAMPVILTGCSKAEKPKPETAALKAQEQQAVDNLKKMPLEQQREFLKNNPQLAGNPRVQAQMQQSMTQNR